MDNKNGTNNSFENEFRSSQVYDTISKGSKNAADGIATGFGKAAEAINGAIGNMQKSVSGNKSNQNYGYNFDPNTGQPIKNVGNTNNVGANNRNTVPPGVNANTSYTPPNQVGANHAPRYVPPQKGVPVPNGGIPENMKMVREKSIAKFYVTGGAAILYSLIFPLYQPFHFIIMFAVLAGVFALSSVLFKGKKKFVPVEPEPEVIEEIDTGNEEIDRIINEGNEYIRKLKKSNADISDEKISGYITRMEKAAQGIFDYIQKKPEKAPQIRKFMNYYLPTTMKLLTTYKRLDRQAVKGENITHTMVEIERMLGTVAGAFEKQLDSLFDEEAMDIGTDIAVFETMLKQEGLTEDEMAMETETK